MAYEQSIPCPQCQTPIPFEARALIAGQSFSCPNCTAAIGLTAGSRDVAETALDKLEAMRDQVARARGNRSS